MGEVVFKEILYREARGTLCSEIDGWEMSGFSFDSDSLQVPS